MNDLTSQVLASINFSSATMIVTMVGLALVGLGFLGFILRVAQDGAKGSTTQTDDDEDDDR